MIKNSYSYTKKNTKKQKYKTKEIKKNYCSTTTTLITYYYINDIYFK